MLEAVNRIDGPAGPLRSLAISLLEEWRWACVTPQFVNHLLESAAEENREEVTRSGKQLPG